MMIKKLIFTILLNLLIFNFVSSHEHWIDLENFPVSVGGKTKIFVCSGHRFPKSEEILSERIFDKLKIISPEGEEKFLETVVDKKLKMRVAEFSFDKEGTYLILFSLQRPPLRKTLYIAKSIVVIGKWSDPKYVVGHGLEIVAEKEFSKIRILYEGKPISLTAFVSFNGNKNFYLKTDKNGYLPLKITLPGKYLITAEYRSVGTSLTFFVPEMKK